LTFVAKADPLEVIVNPDVPKESLSKNALRAIFGMRLRTWQDGTPIRVFALNDQSPIHVRFAKKILNIYPHQLRLAWDRLVYSGTGQAPTEVSSTKEMRAKDTATPGAIGSLPKGMIDDNVQMMEIE
jgi:ABC-type phosphate transport system substrate-binding protein